MTKNIYPGKFIVLEGLDGAGKSTQASMISSIFYKDYGINFCLTSEPSQFLTGGIIRSRLLGEWSSSPECLQLLFAADRAQHLEKEIIPRLKEGNNVVCDRYFLSSVAYGAIDCDFDWLTQLNCRFLAPDITIFLDIDPKTGTDRIIANGKSIELYEKTDILKEVKKNYDIAIEMFGKDMWIVKIDGMPREDKVFESIKKHFERQLFGVSK